MAAVRAGAGVATGGSQMSVPDAGSDTDPGLGSGGPSAGPSSDTIADRADDVLMGGALTGGNGLGIRAALHIRVVRAMHTMRPC